MASRETVPEIGLNVLGYRDGDDWVALALEMDLRGYGPSFEDALDELVELIEMQISFAVAKGRPEMIWKSAEPTWFERYAEARRARYLTFYGGHESVDENYRVRSMPMPDPGVISNLTESGFEPLRA